jgi:electron transfer flavoprotein alpha/beta subunit
LTTLRLVEQGARQRVACPLPTVVSIHPFGFSPRYISVLRFEETEASLIQRILINPEPKESSLQIIEVSPARLRPRRMVVPGAGLSAAQRMQMMMSRGENSKPVSKDKIFEGSVDAAVDRIFDYLREQGFL